MEIYYTYRVIWSDEDDEYVGLCDEFPGLSWLSERRGDAFEGIQRIVKDAVADMIANGEEIPRSSLALLEEGYGRLAESHRDESAERRALRNCRRRQMAEDEAARCTCVRAATAYDVSELDPNCPIHKPDPDLDGLAQWASENVPPLD